MMSLVVHFSVISGALLTCSLLGPFLLRLTVAFISDSRASGISYVGAAKNELCIAWALEDFVLVFYEGGNPGALA